MQTESGVCLLDTKLTDHENKRGGTTMEIQNRICAGPWATDVCLIREKKIETYLKYLVFGTALDQTLDLRVEGRDTEVALKAAPASVYGFYFYEIWIYCLKKAMSEQTEEIETTPLNRSPVYFLGGERCSLQAFQSRGLEWCDNREEDLRYNAQIPTQVIRCRDGRWRGFLEGSIVLCP